MASSASDGASHEDEIHLWREGDWWIATDVETGVTSQGPTRTAALKNLDDAVTLHRDGSGRAPTDEELRGLEIEPAENTTGESEPPDVLE
ncbi:type II toxin-antitoxin system HicB family antitoxin [Natrarchaeobius chitinivorans]|uniref:Type II toxin-antitoxin system HicB family antitoxin n=1 Tax=Natrarchaeobius chitinivorans TaxID=1679083 RepID=A0A3N6N9N4_NATCH|nr:type II toxin-antitoxin system HicB family antitoxin [Natrarchaeobius chitinivorans]RQG95252.1 type II toxin-antitoxin system HicB family antitoxin [Natrarchaeobius chitinivorans]